MSAVPGEQKLAGPLVGSPQVIIDGLAGLLAQFKSDRSPGFLLPHRCAIRRVSASGDIFDPDGNDITATKFAVDCQIEHGQIASAALDLKLCPDRPDVLRAERGLCPGQLSLVPGHLLGRWDSIHLILHGHIPRLGYRGGKHEPPKSALESGRLSGQSGLLGRSRGKCPVAIDPKRKFAPSPGEARHALIVLAQMNNGGSNEVSCVGRGRARGIFWWNAH